MTSPHITRGYTADDHATVTSFSDAASHDNQKGATAQPTELTVPSERDADGEIKQDGVRRTEAITSVWDKKTLVLVFVT